jgi:ribonuclease T1
VRRVAWRSTAALWALAILVFAATFAYSPGQQVFGRTTVGSSDEAITVAALPREAREILQAIKRGGPFESSRDGATFGNYERLLPVRGRGYYREYTVPTPGATNRGARRIIAGNDGEYYYTDDHYRSFKRVVP